MSFILSSFAMRVDNKSVAMQWTRSVHSLPSIHPSIYSLILTHSLILFRPMSLSFPSPSYASLFFRFSSPIFKTTIEWSTREREEQNNNNNSASSNEERSWAEKKEKRKLDKLDYIYPPRFAVSARSLRKRIRANDSQTVTVTIPLSLCIKCSTRSVCTRYWTKLIYFRFSLLFLLSDRYRLFIGRRSWQEKEKKTQRFQANVGKSFNLKKRWITRQFLYFAVQMFIHLLAKFQEICLVKSRKSVTKAITASRREKKARVGIIKKNIADLFIFFIFSLENKETQPRFFFVHPNHYLNS